MADTLIIVESPAKARTINRFLSRNHQVKASQGHVRDLPKSRFGIDLEADFEPVYITIRGKGTILKELKRAAKRAKRVLLATDPDREGEAISWHLATSLGLDVTSACRVEFHEITAKAISEAFKNPRPLDLDYVNAYQARRVLDRIFGYQLSPFLWHKLRYGLSAGRVQSVALRLICERDTEIAAFVPLEYWTLGLELQTPDRKKVRGRLLSVDGGKPVLERQEDVDALLVGAPEKLTVQQVRQTQRQRQPAPPYITSTLQQDAVNQLGFPVRKTMQLAQQLYEGLELAHEGLVGLITYMRTDSTNISDEAFTAAQSYLTQNFGAEYCLAEKRVFPGRKRAQEAHEAVRPTSVERTPEAVRPYLGRDLYRLYKLIWERFLASQCAPALLDAVQVDLPLASGERKLLFRISGSTVRFPGFLAIREVPEEDESDEENSFLPSLKAGMELSVSNWLPKQHFTQPPPRYGEALLVRTMEELGIGRPSTYAATADTLLRREYMTVDDKRFYPTELGRAVNQLLVEHFQMVVETEFTAQIESALDKVESGEEEWQQVVASFYSPFSQLITKAEAEVQAIDLPVELVDEACPQCNLPLCIKRGRFGSFLACTGFPECDFTKSIAKDTAVLCSKCHIGTFLERKSRKGNRVFYGCSAFPECDFLSWEKPVSRTCSSCGCTAMSEKLMKRKSLLRYKCLNPDCAHEEFGELE